MGNPFLTIAIPTYNRSESLGICLSALIPQIQHFGNEIEVIISNNASTDNTRAVVEGFKRQLGSIQYLESESNKGPDVNISKCFELATGTFVWIFSDDDLLRMNALSLIISLLKKNLDCGICYLNSEWYDDIDLNRIESIYALDASIYFSNIDFIGKINYWITFLTAVIFNKEKIINNVDYKLNIGTYLVQLSWVIPAIFLSEKNIIVSERVIVCKSNNSGGYKIYEVFSKNFNKILIRFVKNKVISELTRSIINKNLIIDFFPRTIKLDNKSYDNKSSLVILFKVFWSYKEFWKFIIPSYVRKNNGYQSAQVRVFMPMKRTTGKIKSTIKSVLSTMYHKLNM